MITIQRIWKYEYETIGKLFIEGKFYCYTLELAWRDNKRQISCIPTGEYNCIWQRSPKFGWTYQITNVPNRTRILIHSGNLARHTYGCVILGKYKGVLDGDNAVLVSRPTLLAFHNTMQQEPFKLEII